MEKMIVNNKEYLIVRLLGKGKGGYSYLGIFEGAYVVVKKIHHEPCSYYQFGNKIEAESNDYKRLLETGIKIPKLIEIDYQNEIVVKEYIEGPTIEELKKENKIKKTYIDQVKEMERLCMLKNLNIDYYPTNFIVNENDQIFYIDYECNIYDSKWNYDNWAKQYWE